MSSESAVINLSSKIPDRGRPDDRKFWDDRSPAGRRFTVKECDGDRTYAHFQVYQQELGLLPADMNF